MPQWLAEGYCVGKHGEIYQVRTHNTEETGWYGEGYTDSTCMEEGVEDSKKCNNCFAVIEAGVPIARKNHVFIGDWICCAEPDEAAGHYQLCKYGCGTKSEIEQHDMTEWALAQSRSIAQMERHCKDCGYTQTKNSHVHDLKQMYDDSHHWYECQATDDLECDYEIVKENHLLTNWASVQSRGIAQMERHCTVCDYIQLKDVHVHKLVFKYDDTYHWQECEATDNLDCNHVIEKEKHNMSDWKTGKFEDPSTVGWRHKHCLTAGCEYHVNRPAIWSYSDNPQTGDYIMIAVGVLTISAIALVAMMVIRKEKK